MSTKTVAAKRTGSVKTAAASRAATKLDSAKKTPKLKILMATSEAFPFAGTGGLGEVCGSLPKALNKLGADARVIMPLYGCVPERFREQMEYIGNIRVWVGWRNQYCGLFKLNNDGVTTYFTDNEYYFKRDGIYGFGDDGERFAFFSRAVLDCLPMIGFTPDIIHSNDHATALIPTFYKSGYDLSYGYAGIKNVFTIHNLEYQGWYPSHILGDVFGLDERYRGILDFNNELNCVKGAIETADAVTTVSPTYAKEIQTPERSFGLCEILKRNSGKISGILNGINVDEYDPEKSPFIAKNFDAKNRKGKLDCKRALQDELSFEQTDRPLIAVISRLAGHKGLDLVREDLYRSGNAFENADLVVLGTGERYLEDFFTKYSYEHENTRALIKFDKALAQRIYAGADMFLMPSATEPCGLSQMMACRYGTVPIVRATGGLADSITDCENGGNGFVFDGYSADALDNAVRSAINKYRSANEWDELVARAMKCDFSWNVSAKKYLELYKNLIG